MYTVVVVGFGVVVVGLTVVVVGFGVVVVGLTVVVVAFGVVVGGLAVVVVATVVFGRISVVGISANRAGLIDGSSLVSDGENATARASTPTMDVTIAFVFAVHVGFIQTRMRPTGQQQRSSTASTATLRCHGT